MTETDSTHLPSLAERLVGQRVLVAGDVMLDRFVYGQVERISPEAPIPVLQMRRELAMLGGAGNTVRNIVSLGGAVDFIAVVGGDPAGYEVAGQLAALKGVTPHLLIDKDRPTTLKVRFVAGGQQIMRADQEVTTALTADLAENALARFRAILGKVSVAIFSDYAKGTLSDAVLPKALDEAGKQGVKIIIDPKGRDFSRYRGANVLTPNRRELAEATGRTIQTVADATSAAQQLIQAYGFEAILAKLGGDGLCIVDRQGLAQHVPTIAREVYDVSGAGDTVVAAFGLALAGGLDLAQAAILANAAGSIVVGKLGTAVATTEELAHALRADEARPIERKILARPDAAEQAERWRAQGLAVGFTNGCFDLLHPGHVSLLRQARAACDKLIVALNTDSSVKRLNKGAERPIQNEVARATVLASLADVDMVTLFDEDTPLSLIETLRPDVLVKGADYTKDKVVGAKEVESWGGRVLLADLVAGQSTTAMVGRMR